MPQQELGDGEGGTTPLGKAFHDARHRRHTLREPEGRYVESVAKTRRREGAGVTEYWTLYYIVHGRLPYNTGKHAKQQTPSLEFLSRFSTSLFLLDREKKGECVKTCTERFRV